MENSKSRTGKRVGFWNNWKNDFPQYPMPEENAANYDIERMADYLKSAPAFSHFRGSSTCRICQKPNGSTTKIDGVYTFPSGLEHYVREHHIKLDEDFVEHVEKNQYSFKNTFDSLSDEKQRALAVFWRREMPQAALNSLAAYYAEEFPEWTED